MGGRATHPWVTRHPPLGGRATPNNILDRRTNMMITLQNSSFPNQQRNGWSKKPVEWIKDNIANLSIAFTWHLPQAHQRAVWYQSLGYQVRAGGPAVALMPNYLTDVAEVGDNIPHALTRHNLLATRTSTGCPNHCPFCAAWRVEGDLVELTSWPILPIVCDNNLLACSLRHFDRVIDSLKPLTNVDFNQGLDARHMTKHHATRLAELDCKVRLAFDHVSNETHLARAFELIRKAGFPKKRISVYVLIGYRDNLENALYRLNFVRHTLKVTPFPMRYNPLDALTRNSYVGDGWTDAELKRVCRYFSRLRYLGAIPFEEFKG